LYAPLVGGRDFVSERLELEKQEIGLDLEQLEIQLERVSQLVEQNMVREDERGQIQKAVTERKIMIDKIQKRLDLRARFLAREITAQEVEIEDRMTGAERNLHLAQSKVESLKDQLERLQTLEAQGKIIHMEVKQMQYALDAAQAELKLAILELDVLNKLK
jgi:multidrug resistance efflux pump